MRNRFTEAGFLSGVRDPNEPEPEDTENRSWGTLAKDVAIDVTRPIVSLGQTAAIGAREIGVPGAETAAEVLGDASKAMTDVRSPRARALDTASVDPRGDERSFWKEPFTAGAHMMLGSVPFAAAALATGGASVPAQLGMAALAGVQGAGEGVNQLDDFAKRTPLKELMTLEPFQAAMREFNGDERAAREKLFKDSLDWKASAASFGANAAEFGVFLHPLLRGASPGIRNRLRAALVGGAEGAGSGIAETVTDTYTEQLGKVRTGQQQAIDTGEMAGAVGRGAVFGAPVAAWHAAAPGRPRAATKIDTETKSVADSQINEPPAPPPPPQAPAVMQEPEQPAASGIVDPGAGSPPAPPAPPAEPTPPAAAPAGPATSPTPAGPAPIAEPPPLTSEVEDHVGTFRTAKGSQYYLHPDGTTTRNKAPRPEHPGDEGLQPRSNMTMFLTPGHARVLMDWIGRKTTFGKQLEMQGSRLGIKFTSGPSAGKFANGTLGRVSQQPVVGMTPLELWQGGKYHFGNDVTEVSEQAGVPAQPAPAAAPPAAAQDRVRPEPQAAAGPVSPPVTEAPPAAPQAPSVTPVPVPDVTRAPQTPPTIDAVTRQDVQAIMTGVPPARRQMAATTLQTALQRKGRLTGADLPPQLTAAMAPEDVAALRTAVETDPVTAIEMVRSTPVEQVDAAYESYRQRYPDRAPPDAPPRAATRPEVPAPPPLKTRYDFYGQKAPTEAQPLMPGTRGEAGYEAQEAAERQRLAGVRQQVVPPAQRRLTEKRRRRELFKREVERRAKGRELAQEARPADAYPYASPPKGEGLGRQVERVFKQGERQRVTEQMTPAGPTDEEAQLQKDIADFNTRAKQGGAGLGQERQSLLGRARNIDRKRAERGHDQPFTRSVAAIPDTSTAKQFNDVLAKIDKLKDLPTREIVESREALEAFERLMTINAARGKSNWLPIPVWLYDTMTVGRPQWLANQTAQVIERQKQRQREYEEQRQRLLAAKRAVVKPEMRPVSIDDGINATARFRATYEARTAREREILKLKSDQIVAPVEPKSAKEIVEAEVERRYREAQERVAAGGPLRVPGVALPTKAEALTRLQKHLKDVTQGLRTDAVREAQYEARELAIDVSLREAINNRFGSTERFDQFIDEINILRSKTRPKPSDYDIGTVEAGDVVATTPTTARGIRGLRQQEAEPIRQLQPSKGANKYTADVEAYFGAKAALLQHGRQLKKFLEFAINKINKDLRDYQKAEFPRGGSIGKRGWQLPEGKFNKTTNRFSFNIGDNDAAFAVYGIANDLQKLNEALRYQFTALDERLAKINPAARTRLPRSDELVSRNGQPSTLGIELAQYMRPMNKFFENFFIDMGTYIRVKPDKNGKMDYSKITDARKARSSETTQKYLEGSVEQIPLEDISRAEVVGNIADPELRGRQYEERLTDRLSEKIEKERKAAEEGAKPARNYNEMMQRMQRIRQQTTMTPEQLARIEKARREGKFSMGAYDESGVPVDRFEREWLTEPSEYDTAITEAYEALNSEGTPVHPLISEAVTTRDALKRAAEIVRSGQAPLVPQQYINDQFLNKLADITEGTQVYIAPYDVVSWGHTESAARYNHPNDRIVVSANVSPELLARSIIHEAGHAATQGLLTTDARFASEVRDLLKRAIAKARHQGFDLDRLPRDLYGLSNPSEFIAETISNQKFRDFLETVKAPTNPVIQGARNAMNALYRVIRDAFRRVMGAYDANTALDVLYYDQSTVLGLADQMVKRGLKQVGRQGRAAWKSPEERDPKLYDDGNYYLRMGGVKAFTGELDANLRSYVADTTEKAKWLYETRDRNRGFGLSWHTLADMTHRGAQEFREITTNLFKTIEQTFATRANTIRKFDQPRLEKIAKFFNKLDKGTRQRVEEFLIDESYHGFYADALLSDRKNKHFSDNLANEQSRKLHNSFMTEYKTLSQIDGFTEIRDLLHSWGRERGLQMRTARIRDMLDNSGVVPDNLSHADRQTFIQNAMRVLVSNDRKTASPDILELLEEINEIDEIKVMDGPYLPFVRRGNYAVSGNFILPVPPGATMLDQLNAAGKLPADPRIVFNTKQEAEAYIEKITRDFGITQVGGGEIDIDMATGQRPKIEKDGKKVTARGKDLEALIAGGANIQKKWYAQFQTKLLEFHQTEYEADKATRAWAERHKGNITLQPVQEVYRHDGRQNEQYVGAQLQKMINRLRASGAYSQLSQQEQGAITDQLNLAAAVYTMRRGVKQRFLPRGYVKGASTDITRNFQEFAQMTAGYISKLEHASDIQRYSKQMKEYLTSHPYEAGGDNNALLHQRIYNAYMTRLHSPTLNPRDTFLNRMVDRALRYTMLDKLPSFAYFTINATEPSVIGLPLMAGRHDYRAGVGVMAGLYKLAGKSRFMTDETGARVKLPSFFAGGFADLKKAASNQIGDRVDWLKLLGERVDGEPDADGLKDLFNQASARGIFDASASLEYDRAFGNAPAIVDRVADYLQNVFMAVNTAVENLNRFVTVGTAYRLERAKLGDTPDAHQKAVDYAISISHQANGQYANYNAPERFNTGPFARMLFQFKKYPQRIIANYIRATVNAFGKDPVLRKQGIRQLAFMLATQMMVAGAMGLPLEPFTIPLNAMHIAGLIPYNADDVQAGWRQWSARNFGPEVGEIVMHGPLRLTGVDIGSRLSQASMLTWGSPASTKAKDLQASVFTMMAGATGSTAFEVVTGVQKMNEGIKALANGADSVAYKKFSEAAQHLVLFRTAADVLAAINRSDPSGMRTQSGRMMREPYNLGEAVVRATGFQPAREAESQEARRAIKQATDRLKAERKTLIDQWVQSSPASRQTMMSTIRQYNEGKPTEQRITVSDLMRAQGTRRKAERQDAGSLGLAVDRQMKSLLPDAGAYVTR